MKYRNEYDNWIFTEDDVLINSQFYYCDLLQQYESKKKIGALAIIGVSYEDYHRNIGIEHLHCHGSVALYKKYTLEKIYSKFNMLPHVTKNQEQTYENQILLGEMKFSHEITQLGLRLVVANRKVYNFAYDFMRGIDVDK